MCAGITLQHVKRQRSTTCKTAKVNNM